VKVKFRDLDGFIDWLCYNNFQATNINNVNPKVGNIIEKVSKLIIGYWRLENDYYKIFIERE